MLTLNVEGEFFQTGFPARGVRKMGFYFVTHIATLTLMIQWIRARSIVWLTERPYLFPAVQRLRDKRTGAFCTADTELCIEGFESSANSFLYNIFRTLKPSLNIAHHTHSVANLKRARKYGVPTIVLYRDPEDAIPSLVSRFRPDIAEAILRYVHFYQYVLAIRDHILLVSFQEATEEFDTVVQRLEARSRLSFRTFDPADIETRVVNHIEHWSARRSKTDEMALPVDERERKKNAIQSSLNDDPTYTEAQRLYRTISHDG